jgi:hypothetical protein
MVLLVDSSVISRTAVTPSPGAILKQSFNQMRLFCVFLKLAPSKQHNRTNLGPQRLLPTPPPPYLATNVDGH